MRAGRSDRVAEALSEKELRVLTACVMVHPKVRKLWFRMRKNDRVDPWAVMMDFSGRPLKIEGGEIKRLLMHISALANVDDDVRRLTTDIFEEAGLSVPDL